MHRTLLKPGKATVVVLCLLAIAAYATLMRCLHLLNPDHYYILSPDSYFFHWEASRLLSGQDIPTTWHSGLTYPLAYTAKIIGFISGMTPMEALTLAGKILPPALGIVSVVVMYLAASRMYNWRVGLGAAFSWAILLYAYFPQVAGYLDRDGLSMLLLMVGVFLFYFSRRWHFRVMGKDMGWVMGALLVMTIEGLLVLEWLWLGAVLLLGVLVGYVILEVFVDLLPYLARALTGGKEPAYSARQFLTRAIGAVRRSSWRPLLLVVGVSAVIGMVNPGFPYMYHWAVTIMRDMFNSTAEISELQPLTPEDLYRQGLLIVPLLVGLYVVVTRHRKADLLCFGWLVSLSTLGLAAVRLFMYAAPAECVICGIGLASIFDFESASKSPFFSSVLGALPSRRSMKMCGAVLLLVPLLLGSPYVAYYGGSGAGVNTDWQAALSYLKHDTPEDSVIMSWWDYGYWILDMAERRPVVDNGYYGWDQQRLEDVGLAYCTTDPSEAARVMQKYQNSGGEYHPVYLVFSRGEGTMTLIARYGLGDNGIAPKDLKRSLYYQSLYGSFQSAGGLKRVYPSSEVEDPQVVILALE